MSDLVPNQPPPPQQQNANTPQTQPLSHEQYSNPNPVPTTNLPPATSGFDQTSNPVRSMPMATTTPTPAPNLPSAAGGEVTKVPNLQSNMFKMQRNRSNYTFCMRLPFLCCKNFISFSVRLNFHFVIFVFLSSSVCRNYSTEKVIRRCV